MQYDVEKGPARDGCFIAYASEYIGNNIQFTEPLAANAGNGYLVPIRGNMI
jgi:hypothetical protein